VAVAVYGVNVLIATGEFLEMIFFQFQWVDTVLVIVFLFLLNCVRTIYFILLATEVLIDAPSWISVILVELPSFFYFSAFCVIVSLWLIIHRASLKVEKFSRTTFIGLFLIINFILYSLFVILIVVFYSVPSADNSICGGRLYTSQEWPDSRIVAVVYRCFVALVSLLVALSFIVIGLFLYISFLNVPAKQSKNRKIMVTVMGGVSTIGLISLSIFLVILVIINNQNNYASIIVLLCVEAIPSFVLLIMLHPITRQHKTRFLSVSRKTISSHQRSTLQTHST